MLSIPITVKFIKLTIVVVSILLALVLGYFYLNQGGDRILSPLDIFDDSGCSVSCWDDMQVGKTSEDIIKNYYANHFDNFNKYDAIPYHFYSGVDQERYTTVVTAVRQKQVEAFTLSSPVGFDLSLEEIIERLGMSLYMHFTYELSVETPDIYPILRLYYPDKGYAFELNLKVASRSEDKFDTCVDAKSIPSTIYVVASGSIQDMVRKIDISNSTSSNMGNLQLENYVKGLGLWKGYGCVSIPLPN